MNHASDSFDAGYADGLQGLPPTAAGFSDPLEVRLYLMGWSDGNRESLRTLTARMVSRDRAALEG